MQRNDKLTDKIFKMTVYDYFQKNANISCNLFSDKIQHCFSESFPLVKLSRKRARDKKWITGG